MLNNTWKIPVGDWSDDGHGKCDYYTIKSNFTVEQAREAYFKAIEKSGIDLSRDIASDYEDSRVSESIEDTQFIKDLISEGYLMEWDGSYHVNDSVSMAIIVLRFIKNYIPEFEYEMIEDSIPMLPFYGFDEQGRHIGYFGYGLFS